MNPDKEAEKFIRNTKFTEDFLDLLEKYEIKCVEVFNIYTKQYVEAEVPEIEDDVLVIKYTTDFEE